MELHYQKDHTWKSALHSFSTQIRSYPNKQLYLISTMRLTSVPATFLQHRGRIEYMTATLNTQVNCQVRREHCIQEKQYPYLIQVSGLMTGRVTTSTQTYSRCYHTVLRIPNHIPNLSQSQLSTSDPQPKTARTRQPTLPTPHLQGTKTARPSPISTNR